MEEKRRILKGDRYIWGAFIGLCGISILAMFSASGTLTYNSDDIYAPLIKHVTFLAISFCVAFVVHHIHYKYLRLIGFPLFIVSSLMLLYTLFFGEKVNDAARWIEVFGIPIQPSELAKLGVIITTSYYLAKGQVEKGVSNNAWWKIIIVLAISCVLIFTENFSTAALIGLVTTCMMLIGGVSLKKILALITTVVVIVGGILLTAKVLDEKYPDKENFFMSCMHRANMWNNRIANFTDGGDVPEYEKETTDENFQEHHAYMAIANGRGIGLGIGNSLERDSLPQAYSDFIYAIILEEWGLLGGLFVMWLYLSILHRTLQNTRRCTQAFPAFLMIGIAMLIVFQATINMMVATGVMPVTGQPLPMISRGGTSIVITGVYFGILLNISRYTTNENNGENTNKNKKTEEEDLPESISAPNPGLREDL